MPFAASNFNFLTAARTRTSLTLRLNAAAVLQIYIYFYSDNLRYASQTWALHFSKCALAKACNVQRPARFGGINSHTNYNYLTIAIIECLCYYRFIDIRERMIIYESRYNCLSISSRKRYKNEI